MLKLDKKNSLRQSKEYLKQFYQLFSQILTIKNLLSVFQKYQFAKSIITLKCPNDKMAQLVRLFLFAKENDIAIIAKINCSLILF